MCFVKKAPYREERASGPLIEDLPWGEPNGRTGGKKHK